MTKKDKMTNKYKSLMKSMGKSEKVKYNRKSYNIGLKDGLKMKDKQIEKAIKKKKKLNAYEIGYLDGKRINKK